MDEDPMTKPIDATCPTCGAGPNTPCRIPGVTDGQVMHGGRGQPLEIDLLRAERDQLVGKLARLTNETGARLRVLMVIVKICTETIEKLEPEDFVIVTEAIAKMKPLLAALATLPPLTPLTEPVEPIQITPEEIEPCLSG